MVESVLMKLRGAVWSGLALIALAWLGFIDVGRGVTPDEIKWGPAPPKLPPGAQFAVIQGDPSVPGALYTIRAKLPDGYSVPPHWHPMDEHVTVIEGTIELGMGTTFDPTKLRALATGSFARLPKLEPHFNRYKGPTIVQLHGIGPYDIHYVNPADDPTHGRPLHCWIRGPDRRPGSSQPRLESPCPADL